MALALIHKSAQPFPHLGAATREPRHDRANRCTSHLRNFAVGQPLDLTQHQRLAKNRWQLVKRCSDEVTVHLAKQLHLWYRKAEFRTIASSQGLKFGPAKPWKARNARKYESWTMSSASAWLRTSQNAKLKAASMCGIANLSKLDSWLMGPSQLDAASFYPPRMRLIP